jgi:glycosyltransferase involved in cell wall biosynthesis
VVVSIIIPAYNAAKTIGRTLEACLAQDFAGGEVEIIVVDDGSTDDTAEVVAGYRVKYLHQENAGPAKARNTGWRAARGEFILFTDSDCIPEAKWVAGLLEGFTEQDTAAVGGSYSVMNPESLVASCIQQEIMYRHQRLPDNPRHLGTYNLCVRRAVLDEIGGFDESYPTASVEDAELAYRIIKSGHRLAFRRDVKVGHFHPSRLWGFLRQQFYRAYWRMRVYKQHPDMTKGDDYSGLRDFMQPPMFLLMTLMAPFCFLWPVAIAVGLMAVAGLLLQTPIAREAVRRTGQGRHWWMVGILFLRGFAWAWGMPWGFVRLKA